MFKKFLLAMLLSLSMLLSYQYQQVYAADKKDDTKPAQTKPNLKPEAKPNTKLETKTDNKTQPTSHKDEKTAKQTKSELIDINTATKEQLKTLAGINDTYADKIIANRPYKKKDQLKSKKVLPDNVYESIKEKIVAKQGLK